MSRSGAVEPGIRIVAASEASWDDLQTILTGTAGRCQCTRQRLGDRAWYALPVEERAAVLRDAVGCDDRAPDRDPARTAGIVAYVDDEPAGWAAVDARSAFRRLRGSPVPWAGRAEQPDDDSVWAIACLVVRRGFRGQHLTYALVAAAVEHARQRGARAIEGYPMLTGGAEVTWDELSVGPVGPFRAAGFAEVSHPTKRRLVMRRELG
jgi:GNAT superfamily N-acetyltransferase